MQLRRFFIPVLVGVCERAHALATGWLQRGTGLPSVAAFFMPSFQFCHLQQAIVECVR